MPGSRHCLVFILPAVMLLAGLAPESYAQQWMDGPIAYANGVNCVTHNPEFVTGQYVSYWGSPSLTSPLVGDVFYGRIVVMTVGNACAGVFVAPEVTLPPNTSLAVSSGNPIRCWSTLPGGSPGEFTGTSNCLATPRAVNVKGQYSFLSTPNANAWPLAQGAVLEIWFPVIATAPVNGTLTGFVWSIDGNASPWSTSTVLVYAPPLGVDYPSPAVKDITPTSAQIWGRVLNGTTAGTAYLDWGLTTGYGTSLAHAITTANRAWDLWDDLTGLAPDTTYHFRVRYTTFAGTSYVGVDRTFTTLSAPPVVSIVDGVVLEGNAGLTGIGFNLSLSKTSSSTVTVDYGTADGTGKAGVDYVAATGTVTFPPSFKRMQVWLSVLGDTNIEATKRFVVNLSNPTNATIGRGQAVGTIVDDDGLAFTDAVLRAGQTSVRAVHIIELRQRIDAVRKVRGLDGYAWTNRLSAGSSAVRAVDVTELRKALAAAFEASGATAPNFTPPVPARGVVISTTAIYELRSAVVLLENR